MTKQYFVASSLAISAIALLLLGSNANAQDSSSAIQSVRSDRSQIESKLGIGDHADGTEDDTPAAGDDYASRELSRLGFTQYSKCQSDEDVDRLGDTVTPGACLDACKRQSEIAGCWWVDGTGGIPRDCRVCKTLDLAKSNGANDWARPIDKD